MADPIVVKVSALDELTNLATDDLLQVVDVSESLIANKTKRLAMMNLKLFTSAQITDGIVTTTKLGADSVNGSKIANASISAEHFDDVTFAQNLIYIQLFGVTELVVTTSAKAYFWVPSYLSGKRIKKIGIGLVTAGTSNTTVALSTYANVSGNGYVEGGNLSIALPAAGTKIPINVTAGAGSPKGLDFWFVVGE